MENHQIKVSDLELAYKCTFSEDGRMVTVVIGTQWIPPHRLDFGGDIVSPAGVTPEQFQVVLEIPIQDGHVMMAMSKVEIYSHERKQHARISKSVDHEEFLTKLTGQIQRLVRMKRGRALTARPATRKPLEKLVDEMNDTPLRGEVGAKGRQFVSVWFDKNLASSGDVGETLFLANALNLYRQEYARRHHSQAKEEDGTQREEAS